MQCANFGEDELIEYLLSLGSDVNLCQPGDGEHCVAYRYHAGILCHRQNCCLPMERIPMLVPSMVCGARLLRVPIEARHRYTLPLPTGDIRMVDALVSAGADRLAQDDTGATILDYYRRHRGEDRDDTDLRSVIRGWYTK